MIVRSKFARALAICLACAAAPSLVSAQTPAAAPAAVPEENDALGEIVVTATRREERLQDVPISVTAVTGNKLEQQQIVDVITLAKIVPGMQAKSTLSPLEMTVAIRGISQITSEVTYDPAIGTYVDGVYYVLNAGSNNAMIDMERVEVLKGPQGTLFGRNTIGGAISIITAKPTDSFGGYFQADGGNYGAWTTTGVVNIPIIPGTLDTRFVYQHTQHDGYGTNWVTGNPTNSMEQNYYRGSAKVTFNSNWDMLVSAFYTHAGGYSAGAKLGYIDKTASVPGLPANNSLIPALSGKPGDLLSNYIGKGDWQDAYDDIDSRFVLNEYGITATATGVLNDAVTVKSITGYTRTDYNTISDLGATPYPYINIYAYPIHVNQYSEEMQAYGNAFDDRFKWITGAYAYWERGDQISTASAVPEIGNLFGVTPSYNPTGPHVDNRSYSAFAQATYEVIPKLRLTAGVRYVVDERSAYYLDQFTPASLSGPFVSCSLANAADPVTGALGTDEAACKWSAAAKFHYIPWTAGIDYKPTDNSLVYGKVSKGYRSGAYGLNGPSATAPAAATPEAEAVAVANNKGAIAAWGAVAPESIFSPEIGAKLDFFEHRLRVNPALYYSWYSNIQTTVNAPGACATCNILSTLENIGSATIWGGELEVDGRVGKFELDAEAGYTHPVYTQGPYYGAATAGVSRFNGSLTGSYPFQLSAGTLTLTSTYAYQSAEQHFANSPGLTDAALPGITQRGYGLVSARASFTLRSLPITLSLYGQNLTNVEYKVAASDFAPPLAQAIFWPGAPLTFGGSIRYDF
jgi:iron complex outermembrane receptor protein